ncbi:hypothetical protein EDD15DRAFT_2203726 [Pisolithus albus]|nr:hypothetical protein EDD15DRAFT_2203726 [Pisolithus albus]
MNILALNAYPNGTRVFFWNAAGDIKYGTVQSTSRLADGTQVVVINIDGALVELVLSRIPVGAGDMVNPDSEVDVEWGVAMILARKKGSFYFNGNHDALVGNEHIITYCLGNHCEIYTFHVFQPREIYSMEAEMSPVHSPRPPVRTEYLASGEDALLMEPYSSKIQVSGDFAVAHGDAYTDHYLACKINTCALSDDRQHLRVTTPARGTEDDLVQMAQCWPLLKELHLKTSSCGWELPTRLSFRGIVGRQRKRLIDVHVKPPPAAVLHVLSPADTLATYVRDYKRSGSVTIVEGRRSGDVWISQGDAIDGKGRLGRARYYHNDWLAKTSAKLKCYQCSLCALAEIHFTLTLWGIAGVKKDVYGGEIELIRILDPSPPAQPVPSSEEKALPPSRNR